MGVRKKCHGEFRKRLPNHCHLQRLYQSNGHLYLFVGRQTDLTAELHLKTAKLYPPQIPEIRDVAHGVCGIFPHNPTPPNHGNPRSHTALPTAIVLPHLTYVALKKRLPVHASIWSNVTFFGGFIQNSLAFSALSLPTLTTQKSFSRTTFPLTRSNPHGSALATAYSYFECNLRPRHLRNLFGTETFRARIPQRQGLEST